MFKLLWRTHYRTTHFEVSPHIAVVTFPKTGMSLVSSAD